MKFISRLPRAASLACTLVFTGFLCQVRAAAPEYELSTTGQTVTLMGPADANGNIVVRVAMPDGSQSISQVPVRTLRLKPAVVAAQVPAPVAAPAAPAAPAPAAAPAAPAMAAAPTTIPPAMAAAFHAPASDPLSTTPPVPGTPDFGPNVLVIDPSMNVQSLLDEVSDRQKSNDSAQFNNNRYALLFKPGTYKLDVKLGFYTQAVGLGLKPDDTTFPQMRCNFYGNVTQTFWRAMENVGVVGKECYWGVSQGTSIRRVHVKGNLSLFSGGWASGGFLADCQVEGKTIAGSQQQWFSRNSNLGQWSNAVWNVVFVGVPGAPTGWPSYTAVEKTPLIAEKPFLYVDGEGHFDVMVPALMKDSSGASWTGPSPAHGQSIPIEQFYLAHAGRDTAATINAALASGKNLILTPGIYPLEASIKVTRPNTVVMGMGYATLKPLLGTPALQVADVDGVRVSSILFEAAPGKTPTLLEVGPAGSKASHSTNPTIIYDIFCRVGGAGPGSADAMVTINSNDVIGDNAWLWRADHGAGASWTGARNRNGLVVNGNNVIYYGLAVEHTQEYQTLWNGNNGRVFFYQSEIPYDVPDQNTWRSGAKGWASFKVADGVTNFEAWGMGIYSLFNAGVCILDRAYEVPAGAAGVKLHHLNAINLGGKAGGESGIAHVINDAGDSAIAGNKFKRTTLDEWPAK